jgi:hypothetical protein
MGRIVFFPYIITEFNIRKLIMQPQQITIKATDEDLKGNFSNTVQVKLQQDHFVLDFFMLSDPAGILVSRVVLTPGHIKSLASALNEQIAQYEKINGDVEPIKTEKTFGFRAE